MSVMEFSPTLGRTIRSGPWNDQVISTYQKITDAVGHHAVSEAHQLSDYFVVEAKVCYDLYVQWLKDLGVFASQQGISQAEWENATNHVLTHLSHPDGRAFDAAKGWNALLALEDNFKKTISSNNKQEALKTAEEMREHWRQCHDRHVDLVDGLLSFVADRLGEEALDPAYRFILIPFFKKRYERFDIRRNEWDKMLATNLYLCVEAMRGHLCGPRRWGEMEMQEEADRWVLRFDPCGSCGRAIRGDGVEKTPPRMEPPYNYHVTRKPYPWSWSRTGIDYYHAHTCYLFEILPIETWGYPVRIVEPPTYPDRRCDKCVWYVYKNYRNTPEHFYKRIGKTKPPF